MAKRKTKCRFNVLTRTGQIIDGAPTKHEAELIIADIYKGQRKLGARRPEIKMNLQIQKVCKKR